MLQSNVTIWDILWLLSSVGYAVLVYIAYKEGRRVEKREHDMQKCHECQKCHVYESQNDKKLKSITYSKNNLVQIDRNQFRRR